MTSEELIESGPIRAMTDTEQALADEIYTAVQHYSRHDERGQQTAEYRVGISDLGYCSERTRRMLAHLDPADTDVLAAFIGTAIGDHAERALAHAWPDAILQAEVMVPLQGEVHSYNVYGHPDLIRPGGLLLDGKTTRGLEVVRRRGPNQQQQFQRHCYAYGAYLGGLFDDDVTLDDITVGNFWIDRAADDKTVHVQTEPFDMQIVEAAAMWLDETVYCWQHDHTARKEPPAEVCKATCGFYTTCRLHDTDVEGLLTDDTILAAVDMYAEGVDLERAGRRLKDQAKANLDGVQGSTGKQSVRWVWINGGHVEFDRKGYSRLDIREL